MGDGGPIMGVYVYERDKTKPCSVCTKPGCAPIEHLNEVLSDENAYRFAQVVLDDDGLSNGRAQMLARYILSKKPHAKVHRKRAR